MCRAVVGAAVVAAVALLTVDVARAQDAGTDASALVDQGGDDLSDVGTTADAFVPGCADVLGRPCTSTGSECGAASCLLVTQDLGVCTCSCTPDDPNTPLVDEDDCPRKPGSVCGQVRMSSGWVDNYCFQGCQPRYGENECDPAFACTPRSAVLSGSWDRAVCALPGCTKDDDCVVTTQKSCDTAQTGQCAADETCLALLEGGTAGVCVKAGTCDTASGLCDKHPTKKPAAKVGDPCLSDFDCGEHMSCEQELDGKALGLKEHGDACSDDSECCGVCDIFGGGCEGTCAVRARHGYCLLSGCAFATATDYSERACPTGSTCHRLYYGGVCFKTCDPANPATCRGSAGDLYGDYECRAWNNIEVDTGVGYSDAPVCEFGDVISCDIFSGSTLDCAALGLPNNPTDMACRKLDGTQTLVPDDPGGFCLDTSGSGPVPAQPADGGVVADGAGADGAPAADGATGDGSVGDGGVTSRDVAFIPPDTGMEESDVPAPDTGAASADAGVDGGAENESGGGGCSVGLRVRGHGGGLIVCLLALWLGRRRRRR